MDVADEHVERAPRCGWGRNLHHVHGAEEHLRLLLYYYYYYYYYYCY